MPLRYQLYEDFIRNSEALNVESAASLLAHRLLLVHGTHDETVPIDDTEMLAKRTAGSVFVPIHGANHTFGGSHPVRSNVLPAHMALVVQKTIDFFRSVSVF
jgi:dipeptidyl aminopeptidase/acylaminoacyl peptidase